MRKWAIGDILKWYKESLFALVPCDRNNGRSKNKGT